MVKEKIYMDTSVFGGHFDPEFAEHTIPLFDRLKNGYPQLEIRSPREFRKYEND
jgi:hypothetical protein